MMKNKAHLIKPIELEWHQLELRYSDLRIHTNAAVKRFMLSIDEHGLLTPIIIVPSDGPCPWIVVDGYLRCAAAKRLHHDTLLATPWNIALPDALLTTYQQDTSRPWDKLEEARLIQELTTLHGFSQSEVAKRLGKSTAWISHRLQLLQDLPAFVNTAIQEGALSTWTASRIIIPFARANTEHSKQLVEYLCIKHHASRDIQAFYEQYLRSNRHVRDQMAANPTLFFKAHAFKKIEECVALDKLAPESIWESKTAQLITGIQTLSTIMTAVFYRHQDNQQQDTLIKPFQQLIKNINTLHETLRRHIHASATHETNSEAIVSIRE